MEIGVTLPVSARVPVIKQTILRRMRLLLSLQRDTPEGEGAAGL